MEAADDICYAVVDLEDAYRLGLLSAAELRDLFDLLCYEGYSPPDAKFEDDTAIVMLRSFAISGLTEACMKVWRNSLEAIENGTFTQSLIEACDKAEPYKQHKQLKSAAKTQVYTDERVLLVEYAGYQTIGGLLDFFYPAIVGKGEGLRERKLRRILPASSLRFGEERCENSEAYLEKLTAYERLLVVTDYISGLTDRTAVDLYQKLSGIKLPS